MPCAGYSGFVIEPCSGRLLIREEPRYAMHAPTNCQPFGRSDRPLAALMQAYRAHGFPELQRVCRRTLRALAEAPLPVVNWYQEVAREAAISARRATAA